MVCWHIPVSSDDIFRIRSRRPAMSAGAAVSLFSAVLSESAVFPHIDIVVIGKSSFCISVCPDQNVFLFFFLTCFVEHFREKFPGKRIRRIPLGLVSFIVGRSLPQMRYHRNRLNFIKLVISVCFESLLGINFFCSIIYIGIKRRKIRALKNKFSVYSETF